MDSHFQIVILGTGLSESIAAAALAKAGFKVAHIDVNPYYGSNEASLTTQELQECIPKAPGKENKASRLRSGSFQGDLPSNSRDYSLSLSPSIIPSRGTLITSLIGSGVARYGGFKLLESVSVYSADGFKNVPGSREDIFKSKDLSLIDKRRLMRFLMFASGEFESSTELQEKANIPFVSFLKETFSINGQLASVLACALALCESPSDTTINALERIRRYLRSSGRYGPSPFLVGQYGGLGELAQGFCRVCAVSGGTYILGRDVLSIEANSEQTSGNAVTRNFRLKLSDVPEDLTSDLIISSSDYLSHLHPIIGTRDEDEPSSIEKHAKGITIVDGVISRPSPESATTADSANSIEDPSNEPGCENKSRPIDAALLVFLPGELSSGKASGPVNVLINGEGTLSCPRGKSLLYLSTPINIPSEGSGEPPDPESLLRPYLDTTLSLLRTPDGTPLNELSSAFFVKARPTIPESHIASLKDKHILISQPIPEHLAIGGDAAATSGEVLFRDALKLLGRSDAEEAEIWPPLPPGMDDEDDDTV